MSKQSIRLASVAAVVLAAAVPALGQQAATGPVAATTAAAGTGPAAAAPVALRYVFTGGQHMRYTTRTVQNAPAPIGQTVTTGNLDIETLQPQPNGGARRRLRLSGLEMEGAAIPPELRTRVAQSVNGLAVEYTQNTRGAISEREVPANVPPELRPIVESVLQSLDQMTPVMPEGAVSLGDTWTDHSTLHLAVGPGTSLDLDVDSSYTLREVRGSTVVVGIAMTMGMRRGLTLGTATIRGAGNATGNATLDLARGGLTQSHSTGAMTMHVTAQGRSQDIRTTFENDMREAAARAVVPAAARATPTRARPRR